MLITCPALRTSGKGSGGIYTITVTCTDHQATRLCVRSRGVPNSQSEISPAERLTEYWLTTERVAKDKARA